MRERGGRATLGELIGGKRSAMSLDNLEDILGEKMPELPRTQVGRFRLVRALRNRFGDGYRNIPGVKGIIKDFEEDMRFEEVLGRMKKVGKPRRENG